MLRPRLHPSVIIAMTTKDDYRDTVLLEKKRTQSDRLTAKHIGLQTLWQSPDDVAYCNQIHTDIIYQVTAPWLQWDGDAMITDVPWVILQIWVADCTPIILTGEKSDGSLVIAAIHSGRWPTSRNIVGQVVEKMRNDYHASHIKARIGPSAGRDAYEFWPEAYEFFGHQHIRERDGNVYLHVAGQVHDQLIDAGLIPSDIQRDPSCTITESERFFSYRRDGLTGQNMYAWVAIV